MVNNDHNNGDAWWSMMIWLLVDLQTALKNDGVKVSDDIPNWMESHKIPWFQTAKQFIDYIKII